MRKRPKHLHTKNKAFPRTQFAPHLAFCRRWWSLCWFAAVWGAAVRPQWDLGLVRLPPRQITHLSGVFGVLVGQLLLKEGLKRDEQQQH